MESVNKQLLLVNFNYPFPHLSSFYNVCFNLPHHQVTRVYKYRAHTMNKSVLNWTHMCRFTQTQLCESIEMEQHIFKNVNNWSNTNIYSYLLDIFGQSSNPYLNVVHFC